MFHISKAIPASLTFVLLYLASAIAVHAAPVMLTNITPARSALQGTSVTYFGTITNSGQNPFFFEQGLLTGLPGSLLEDRIFNLQNFIVPGLATTTLAILQLQIAPDAPLGIFTGSLQYRGCETSGGPPPGNICPGNALELTNSVSLQLTVLPQTAPVPEPTAVLLLGSGLAGVGAAVRKRRSSRNEEKAIKSQTESA